MKKEVDVMWMEMFPLNDFWSYLCTHYYEPLWCQLYWLNCQLSLCTNEIYVSRMFGQMVIVWLISTFRGEKERENQLHKLLGIWQSVGYSGSLIYIEAKMFLIEKVTVNSDGRFKRSRNPLNHVEILTYWVAFNEFREQRGTSQFELRMWFGQKGK